MLVDQHAETQKGLRIYRPVHLLLVEEVTPVAQLKIKINHIGGEVIFQHFTTMTSANAGMFGLEIMRRKETRQTRPSLEVSRMDREGGTF